MRKQVTCTRGLTVASEQRISLSAQRRAVRPCQPLGSRTSGPLHASAASDPPRTLRQREAGNVGPTAASCSQPSCHRLAVPASELFPTVTPGHYLQNARLRASLQSRRSLLLLVSRRRRCRAARILALTGSVCARTRATQTGRPGRALRAPRPPLSRAGPLTFRPLGSAFPSSYRKSAPFPEIAPVVKEQEGRRQ